ncbi:hypothetical protein [Afipia clevelandensis]|uniref:Uncharacterized protein n=1 Tax=Afipia clevelandensis ATCC 49720 TaxID=883079 RepID=K8PDK9_9BRAD|nr:hypothetical protein [Afipia clevelandensis]EKS37675.1 hypothetical protein HMPREF9696_01625 [Afipia clevelandensis ATCC 49720]
MSYRLVQKKIGDLYVYTSPDLPGLYVAHPDEATALGQVPESIAAIERINARRDEREQVQKRYA